MLWIVAPADRIAPGNVGRRLFPAFRMAVCLLDDRGLLQVPAADYFPRPDIRAT